LKHLIINSILLIIIVLIPLKAFPAEICDVTFKGEIANGVSRLGGEAVDLLATPLQLENGNLFITLGVAAAVGITYAFDTQIRDKLTARPSRSLTNAANAGSLAGDPFLHLGLATLVYGGGIVADSARWKEAGEMMGEALILADAATLILKETSGRGRPDTTGSKGDFRPFGFKSNYDSFPSMHTSSSFALASVLAKGSENIAMKAAYYGAASFVGYSRVYKNKHWASDVILGAALGELCGRVVTSYHAEKSKLALVPQTYESGLGLALVGKW